MGDGRVLAACICLAAAAFLVAVFRFFDFAARLRADFTLRFLIAFFAADLLPLGIGASSRDAIHMTCCQVFRSSALVRDRRRRRIRIVAAGRDNASRLHRDVGRHHHTLLLLWTQ